jgi:hypothetical protein
MLGTALSTILSFLIGKIDKSGKFSHLSLTSTIYPNKRDERRKKKFVGQN